MEEVTKALGWTSIEVGQRHHLVPGTIDRVEGRRTHGRPAGQSGLTGASREPSIGRKFPGPFWALAPDPA